MCAHINTSLHLKNDFMGYVMQNDILNDVTKCVSFV